MSEHRDVENETNEVLGAQLRIRPIEPQLRRAAGAMAHPGPPAGPFVAVMPSSVHIVVPR